MFRRGVAAAQRYTSSSELYLCPICETGFSQSALLTGELTLDEAPPASVGGKGIALTCKDCNNKAGYSIDAAVDRRAKLNRFAEVITHGATGRGGDGSLQIGEERVNIRVFRDANATVRLEILEYLNNPRVIERVSAYAESLARDGTGEGEELHITSRARYHGRLAMVGDLKAAFLIAFAAFGYRYAFDPRLDLVRQQILNPRDHVIDGWTIALNQSGDTRYLLLITELLPGVVVKLDRVGILLPWLNSTTNFYSDLATRYKPNEAMQLSGKSIAWPTRLEMALDFWHPSHTELQS
jgi:hypothetical protein